MKATLVLTAAALAAVGGFAAEPDSTAAEATSPPSVTLKWSALNEGAVYGYLVYRAEQRQGPFLRTNPEIIHIDEPAGADTANSYRFVDTDVEPGVTYYYYLDTISLEGRKTRFSGVIKKTVADPQPTQAPEQP